MTLILKIGNANSLLAFQDRQREWLESGGTIGRGADNDWVLPDDRGEISRVHAKISYNDGHYYLEDVSTNGVYLGVQHQRLEKLHCINAGDIIHIGHYQINIDLAEEEPSLPEPFAAVDDHGFDLASELDFSTPALKHSDISNIPDAASLIKPVSSPKPVVEPVFIPEDWAAGVYNTEETPQPPQPKPQSPSLSPSSPPPPPAPIVEPTPLEPLSKKVAFKMMDQLLSHFDTDYTNACLFAKGGRDKVFEEIFDGAIGSEQLTNDHNS